MKRMTKWLSAFVALLLLASLSVPVAMAADLYYEATQNVNLRKGAGTSFETVTTIPKGDVVVVTSMWYSEWWKVKYTNSSKKTFEGYVKSSLLKKSDKRENKEEEKKNTAALGCYSTTLELHLRSGPGTSYSTRTTVPKGNVVNVTDTTNKDWFKVTFINSKGSKYADGYLSSAYLKKAAEPYNISSKTDLRKKASKSSKSLRVLPKGSYVLVTSFYSKTWYKVSYTDPQGNTTAGFVLKSKLKKGTVTNVPYKQVDPEAEAKKMAEQWRTKKRYQVTKKSKLMKKASKKGKVITKVPKNAVVAVIGSSKKYKKVIYCNSKGKKQVGYLPKSVLKKYQEPDAGAYVTSVATQLRATDSLTGDVMAEIPQYTLFHVKDCSEKNWYLASYTDAKGNTQTGFVYKDHAQKYVETNGGLYFTFVSTQMRRSASETGEVIVTLPQGAQVDVKETYNPDWFFLTYTSEGGAAFNGYVPAQHLRRYQGQSLEYVASVATWIRTLPSQTGTVIADLPQGQAITVTDTTFGEWFYVTYTDAGGVTRTGYVYTPHIKTRAEYEAELIQAQQNQQQEQQQNQDVSTQSEEDASTGEESEKPAEDEVDPAAQADASEMEESVTREPEEESGTEEKTEEESKSEEKIEEQSEPEASAQDASGEEDSSAEIAA